MSLVESPGFHHRKPVTVRLLLYQVQGFDSPLENAGEGNVKLIVALLQQLWETSQDMVSPMLDSVCEGKLEAMFHKNKTQ